MRSLTSDLEKYQRELAEQQTSSHTAPVASMRRENDGLRANLDQVNGDIASFVKQIQEKQHQIRESERNLALLKQQRAAAEA